MRARRPWCMLVLIPLAGCTGGPPTGADADCFASLAIPLAADEMEGRGVGTEGLGKAADLVEERMRAIGLEGPYRQAFEVTTGVALGDGNQLTGGEVREDFVPLGFSAPGAFEGQVVVAGYGIRAEELGYDDYAGVDVEGRVVLAMRYEPREDDEDSAFDGKRPSRWSDLRYKALRAREAGASALLLVNPPVEDDPDKLPSLRTDGPQSHAGLPVVQVTRAWVDDVVGEGVLSEVHAAIEADEAPHSRVVDVRVQGAVDVIPTRAPVENVIGTLPGGGSLASEVVVVGAHYDHLGYGGRGSFEPDVEAVHNGADDNASGVAAMLCAVGQVAASPPAERRTLVAIAFAAEELGLGGSGHYVEHPRYPVKETVAMVNLDMVGRVREGKLQALGAASAPEWDGWLAAAAEGTGLEVDGGGDGYGPSDQMSFYTHGVPVVHLFSGAHEQYHVPGDDADLLNLEGGGQVAALTANLLDTLLQADPPTYREASGAPTMQGDSRGYGAYLGTIPDYTTMMATEGGVKLSGVREGGPADRAGIRGGDVIVGIGGIEIQNLYDMTFALRDHKPGQTVEVVVLRDGEEHHLQATLGKRGQSPDAASPHGAPHGEAWSPKAGKEAAHLLDPRETHLADLRQLTFGGENAEAYWSPDGRSLIFQRTEGEGCDQQYVLDLDTGETTLVSSGKGRTTCGYFVYPEGERVLYATTEGAGEACPPPPDRSKGYVWPLYDGYDIVVHAPGGEPEPWLPHPGYDAEATVCMTDGRVVFTSVRDGDLDLYVANSDGTGLHRLTDTPGYDGGAFFTPDCGRIVWRASRPDGEALAEYRALLEQDLVRPGQLDLYVMDADGTNVRRLTDNGAANFGPYPLPDASGVLFSSNAGSSPREFDLYLVPMEGGEPEQVTFTEQFDGFPMFSPDGEWLAFASNRGGEDHQTNLFVARWVP